MPTWAIILLIAVALIAIYYLIVVPIMAHLMMKRFDRFFDPYRENRSESIHSIDDNWEGWR